MTRRDRLPHATRLLNHGPTVLVSAAHAGRANDGRRVGDAAGLSTRPR